MSGELHAGGMPRSVAIHDVCDIVGSKEKQKRTRVQVVFHMIEIGIVLSFQICGQTSSRRHSSDVLHSTCVASQIRSSNVYITHSNKFGHQNSIY